MINWELYKGKDNNRAKQAYIGLIEQLNEEGYKLLSEYKNARTKVKLRCNKGHEYEVSPYSFKNGFRCPVCSGQHPETAKNDFIELVEKEGYKLLSEYINSTIKVKLQCDKNHEYEVVPNNFKSGNRCPHCSGNPSHPLVREQAKEDFIEQVNKAGYKLLSEYKGTFKKCKLMCDKNHEYEVIPSNFTSGNRCPHCNISKGEKRVADYLDLNNIKYVAQKRFKKCKFKNTLPFDFYIPNKNLIIEFDGEQHYRPVEYFGGSKTFQENFTRDSIKNAYCILNNIKLVRIGYHQIDEVENILNKVA